MFHGQSRNGGAHPKPLSGTQQQNARLRVLKIVKFTSLFRALQFPLDGKRINSKWVFKRRADGSIKARVVAQYRNEVPGLDSASIYAPVCMIQSVRIICCIAVHFGLLLHRMDVSTASLYADIQELVFVEQPP